MFLDCPALSTYSEHWNSSLMIATTWDESLYRLQLMCAALICQRAEGTIDSRCGKIVFIQLHLVENFIGRHGLGISM
jgi:hypothetical protein